MRVSIALATYNGARFLREQLASLVGQTVLPAELVVSDDGSTDETLAIVRDFAGSAPFPVTVAEKNERLGFSDNFLFAAERCQHDLVAFCDQDDVWLPAKLETALRRMHDDGSVLTLHTHILTDENLKPYGHWMQDIVGDRVHEPLALDPYRTGWGNSMLFRRELLALIARERRPRQPEEPHRPLSHDTWIYMLAAALGRVSHLASPLILYRQHGANSMGFGRPDRWRRLAQMRSVPLARYKEHALINGLMAGFFDEISRTPGPFADRAAAAASCFRERQALQAARAAVFTAPGMGARLRSYRAAQRLAGPSRHWIGSRIKDVVIGVTGLHALGRTMSASGRRNTEPCTPGEKA